MLTKSLNFFMFVQVQDEEGRKLTLLQAVKNIHRPDVYRPVLLVLVNFNLMMLTGPFVIVFYAVDIFQSAGVEVDSNLAAIIIAAIRIVGKIQRVLITKLKYIVSAKNSTKSKKMSHNRSNFFQCSLNQY